MSFGERIVQAREKAGMSQRQLAESLGITPTRLNYWEKDKRQPDVLMIKAIAKKLNVTGDYLIGNDIEDVFSVSCFDLSQAEKYLIWTYRKLNGDGQNRLMGDAEIYASNEGLKKGSVKANFVEPAKKEGGSAKFVEQTGA